jgi:hypothetical protein
MRNWTETDIGIIYFTGLFIALIISVLIVLYLSLTKSIISKIAEKFETSLGFSFRGTILLAGLLGAMSVSFTDCSGHYGYLLSSKFETVMQGLEQVSSSLKYLYIIIGFWLLVFVVARLIWIKRNKIPGT